MCRFRLSDHSCVCMFVCVLLVASVADEDVPWVAKYQPQTTVIPSNDTFQCS